MAVSTGSENWSAIPLGAGYIVVFHTFIKHLDPIVTHSNFFHKPQNIMLKWANLTPSAQCDGGPRENKLFLNLILALNQKFHSYVSLWLPNAVTSWFLVLFYSTWALRLFYITQPFTLALFSTPKHSLSNLHTHSNSSEHIIAQGYLGIQIRASGAQTTNLPIRLILQSYNLLFDF